MKSGLVDFPDKKPWQRLALMLFQVRLHHEQKVKEMKN